MPSQPIRHVAVISDAGQFTFDQRHVFLIGLFTGWGVPITEEFLCRFRPGQEEYTVVWGDDYQHMGVVTFLFGGQNVR